jgi:hypothetical protein
MKKNINTEKGMTLEEAKRLGFEPFAENESVPASPPLDYDGTIADWYLQLEMRGLEIDSYISQDEWWEILEACEE